MSRLLVSNHVALDEQLYSLRRWAALQNQRALIICENPPAHWLQGFSDFSGARYIAARTAADRADRVTELLGCEFEILVHETDSRPDIGLLAALTGTVKSGGVLVLGIPFTLESANHAPKSHAFNHRFLRLLRTLQQTFPAQIQWVEIETTDALDDENLTDSKPSKRPTAATTIDRQQSITRQLMTACPDALQEQNHLLQEACQHLAQHAKSCISITGRRGRGKSALLGRIAHWLTTQAVPYSVTAARQSALNSLRRHSQSTLNYLPPELALKTTEGVLLVEEASSLPITTLTQLAQRQQQIIFCTTVEGYENAGRAFAIRLSKILERHFPHQLQLRPTRPWRWGIGDPLEQFVDALLMNDNEETTNPTIVNAGQVTKHCATAGLATRSTRIQLSDTRYCIRQLDQTQLASDESLLRSVFTLLRDTHYQTSTIDLAHLLDAPDLQVWVLENDSSVTAALLLAMEGGIESELHEDIVSKQRRIPHQLLPQLLAQCANQPQALEKRYARVIRISVVASQRRQGLASRLLANIEHELTSTENPIHCIGASFASDTSSVAFWQSNQYQPFHLGFRANPRTGKPAVAVIKAWDSVVQQTTDIARQIFQDNLDWRSGSPQRAHSSAHDWHLLRRFAAGQRSAHDTFAALNRLAKHYDTLTPSTLTQGNSWQAQEKAMRQAVLRILTDAAAD